MPERGLYEKYHVCDAVTGVLLEECFVLRPRNDPAARLAMQKYSEVTENLTLSRDLAQWLADLAAEEQFAQKVLWQALRILYGAHFERTPASTYTAWESTEMRPIREALERGAHRGQG